MRNFKDIILEKLRVTKNVSTKPELVDHNIVSCTMEFFFNWIMVVDQTRDLTQEDFEDFEILSDEKLQSEFNTYENLFAWYEDNKDEIIEVTITKSEEGYKNIFSYDEIEFKFYSGDNLIDTTK